MQSRPRRNTDVHRWRKTNLSLPLFYLCLFVFICGRISFADDAPKLKIAVFPLGGSADQELRDKVGFSLRAKIDRDGTYDVIDGPTMADLVGDQAFAFDTKLDVPEKFAKDGQADIMIWGELNAAAQGEVLRVHVFDNRQLDPLPHSFEKPIKQPTDMRFVVEEILQTLDDIKPFEHPNEVAVANDPNADKLFLTNPNLVVNGTFDKAANWAAIYQDQKYTVKIFDTYPDEDHVCILRQSDGDKINNVLAMNLSKQAAENNGLACLSDSIAIEPHTRYRLTFRYNSDGPTLHVFVKGYTMGKNLKGEMVERECYRRQVPPTGQTKGDWVTITDELNPQHSVYPVQFLRIDLYAYLSPGKVMFDDVVLKAVGAQNRVAKDDAIKPPAGAPTPAK